MPTHINLRKIPRVLSPRKFIKIPVFKPSFGEEEGRAASSVIKSGNIVAGRLVAEFEEKFARYVGSKYAVAVNSCTSAIFLCLKLLDPKKVQIPSVTHVSVTNSILHAQSKLEFVDEVHVGHAYQLRPAPIWDSAHELSRGCFYGGLNCYSFYPTKNLASTEGGMIATDAAHWANWLRCARMFGIKPGKTSWDYKVSLPGWKMAMNEVQAAVCLEQLKKLNRMNSKRKKVVDTYNKAFNLSNSSLHVYPILVKNRKEVIQYLGKKGIGTTVYYKPIHLQPYYRKLHPDLDLPRSEHWGKHELSIPIYADLAQKEVKYVAQKILSIAKFVE